MYNDKRYKRAMKLFRMAGMNPTTPEQLAAYQQGLKLMQKVKESKPAFGGYIGKAPEFQPPTKREKAAAVAKKLKATLWEGEVKVLPDLRKPIEAIPWDKFFKRLPDDYKIFEIEPTKGVRNNQAAVIAKVISTFYRRPGERRKLFKDGTAVTTWNQYRVNFRIVMRENEVRFYLMVPTEKAGEILRKAEAIYDSGITINEVEGNLEKLDPDRTFCTELRYRKHDIFSLATDKDNNYPLPSMLTAVRSLEEGDVAVFDAMLEPYDRIEWYKEAKQAHKLLEKGYVPNNGISNKMLRLIHSGFEKLRYEIVSLTRFTKEQKQELQESLKEAPEYLEAARIREEMSNPTKRKKGDEILNSWLRIAVQSDQEHRARDTAYTIANSWKDISADNELERRDIPKKWNKEYVKAIEDRKTTIKVKGIPVTIRPNKFSTDEAGKLMQLPGRSLIEEFPQINAQRAKEVHLPEELTQQDIKTVRLGHVTERGKTKLARIPLEAYNVMKDNKEIKIKLKQVYDALCTSSFGQGKQGSGKSEGYGTTWAYDMVMAGFTAILIDTADGQVLRNFIDSLPADYPEEKIHALNFDNKAWPIPTGWEDVYGRDYAGTTNDDELAALEISERLTDRFVGFINSLKGTGDEFSDRMTQYVVSCMRAITTRPGWAFIDLDLALTSPAYRDELLERDEVKDMPEVVRDLKTLQEKTLKGTVGQIVDPILSRLKVLSGSPFMANLFYQAPKLDKNGKPILDLRKIMDNPEGGYGHVVAIQASYDSWQEHQATILGFFEDKINFNAFSRIDVNQDERKPVLKWIDEPHKVIKAIEGRLAGTSVEFRKYRVKNLFTGHSIDQMGAAADALLDGGAQITSYKTERESELKRFANQFKPYDDHKELYDALPDQYRAINKVRLPSGNTCPAFIADMVVPPKAVKDRSHVWQRCAEKYGRPWKEVRANIQGKRQKYQELDIEWLQEQEEAAKEAKKAARKAK